MTERRKLAAQALCIAFAVLGVADAALAALIHLDSTYHPEQSLVSSLPDVVQALAWAIVGAGLAVKRADNLVGWSVALAGGGLLLGGLLGNYGELALLAKPGAGLPGGAAAGAIGDGAWTSLTSGVFLLLLLFPAGRVPSARWRPVAVVVLAGFAITWAGIAIAPGRLDPPLDAYENPLAFAGAKEYLPLRPTSAILRTVFTRPVLSFAVVMGACLVGIGLAASGLVLRFRRSRGLERQQFKWLAASAALLVLSLPSAAAFGFSGVGAVPFSIALIALPVSIGIAVLRHRLYEIDVIIRRTLVYGVLTGCLAATYLGIVLLLQRVFSSFAGGSNLAIAASTLAVAALARPARARVQALVDRRFYRRKYDAERTLAAFATRVRDEVDLDALRAELRAVVAATMQPAHVSLWLRDGGAAVTDPVTIPRRSLSTKETA